MQDNKEIYHDLRRSCVVCNSCRYCEGLCATFPAMEKYRDFKKSDLDYLANLCHQCSECFYDCQYAPPHEFNVSLPAQFARARKESYKDYAYPRIFSKAFERNATLSTAVLVLVLFLGFILAQILGDSKDIAIDGNFYYVIPYHYMVYTFSITAILVCLVLCLSVIKYIRAIGLRGINIKAILKSIKDSLSLTYLGGHKGEGCTYPNIERSNTRRLFHHLTSYGFLFCFIATSLAAFYEHILHISAPYSLSQLPKLFGLIGGVLLCIGVLGLFILKLRADKEIKDIKSIGMDYVFLFMLFVVSFSGLALMAFRVSEFLSPLLWFHLSCVMAFFVMIPYSKFVHIFYRFFALLKYNAEE